MAIIVDHAEASVITTRLGEVTADMILWVTRAPSDSPFQQVAGTLLKTLQSAMPSPKVSWIIEKGGDSGYFLWQRIGDA